MGEEVLAGIIVLAMGGVVNEKALGEKLQLARRRAGLTQQELCQKAGLSYSTLAKIERGAIKTPSVFTVAAISEATGTPLEDLLDLASKRLKSPAPAEPKKTSKSGVKFVYFDINDVLVRFFHRAFTDIARKAGKPADLVETIFWRHNEAVNKGIMGLKEFNNKLGKELEIADFDWIEYYMANVEPMPGVAELVKWAATHYEVGLLSNSMPTMIDELKTRRLIPVVDYVSVVDSCKVGSTKPDNKIYETAQQLAAQDAKAIMLIDNERPNLTAADRAGWHVLWFDNFHPDESIKRIREALAF